ncbi:phage tail protein [Barnesiella viscericola]|uniref:phage tail protein n=1 Tax=Barnesiella viscericola TaxID=397865 RepID=UPI003209B500
MTKDETTQNTGTQAQTFPDFYFKVNISNVGEISCREVSGLESEYEETTYRAGDSPVFTKLKMPGLRKAGDLTIKQGISKDDKAVLDWVDQVKQNIIQRETMTVSLLDESGNPVQTWEAVNAWPKKLTREEKTDGIAYSFETLVIAHEGVYVK